MAYQWSWQRWSEHEDAILHEHYPALGAKGILEARLLPGRPLGGIRKRANKIGVVREKYLNRTKPYRSGDRRKSVYSQTELDWRELRKQIPPDDRDLTGRLLGDPVFERSALAQAWGKV